MVACGAAAVAALFTSGCDQGPAHVQPTWGPQVNIVATNVGPKQALPADGVIQIAFDRLLLPATAVRQSFILVDANENALEPLVTYDPVTRVVSLSDPGDGGWLKPGQPYSIFFGIAKPGDDESGVRAIDGAPLAASSAGQLGFITSAASGVHSGDAKVNFCNDVLPIFAARCTNAACHSSEQPYQQNALDPSDNERFPNGTSSVPAMGLILDSSAGILATAIGRVAQESNTGASAQASEAPGTHFGIDMPIIDPGNPASSWLLYKLLLARFPEADAGNAVLANTTCLGAAAPTDQPPPLTQYELLSDDERTRLSNYVLGNQMPYPTDPGTDNRSRNLTMDELERVRAWIAAGANVTDCSVCSN